MNKPLQIEDIVIGGRGYLGLENTVFFKKMAAMGFKQLEIDEERLFRNGGTEDDSPISLEEIADRNQLKTFEHDLSSHGLKVFSVHSHLQLIDPTEESLDENRIAGIGEVLESLNCQVFLFHAGGNHVGEIREGKDPEGKKRLFDNISKIRDIFKKHSIKLTIETGSNIRELAKPADLQELFEEIPDIFWTCDIQHCSKWECLDYFDPFGDRLFSMHIPDGNPSIIHGGVPGHGTTQVREYFQQAKSKGFTGPLVTEAMLDGFYRNFGYYLDMLEEEGLEEIMISGGFRNYQENYAYTKRNDSPKNARIPVKELKISCSSSPGIPDLKDLLTRKAAEKAVQLWNEI